ncbi:MAG: EamA family transporter RarD [Nocardioidaceae bacterium]|nr:MAG: EamA family transporter RarD [Nocardioidaceae bacterium]
MLFGIAAYTMWGLFPLYWPLLEPAGVLEILSHRVVWSALFMMLLVALTRRAGSLRALTKDRRKAAILLIAAILISFNWGVYIWAVNHDHVIESSLGYFINPLINVLLGVLLLGEQLRLRQWAALAVAAVGVVVLAVDARALPWIALVLAGSFGFYGLLKKWADAGAIESLTLETLFLIPAGMIFLLANAARGNGHFLGEGADHSLLFVGIGITTAIPLLCFGAAATRIPLSTLGLLQYIGPTLQFVIGVALLKEQMSGGRWIGFTLVWIALAAFTMESLHHRRSNARPLAAMQSQ